jgi:hypothetical protein
MEASKSNLIRLLEAELDFLEGGGYASPAGQPGKERRIFDQSLVCINHWFVPGHKPECHEDCALLDAVPPEHKAAGLPCHFIRLNEAGDTVASLEQTGDRDRLQAEVGAWLRRTIQRLKQGDDALGSPEVRY